MLFSTRFHVECFQYTNTVSVNIIILTTILFGLSLYGIHFFFFYWELLYKQMKEKCN